MYLRDFLSFFRYNRSIKEKAGRFYDDSDADKKRQQVQMFCMDDKVPHFSTFGKNYTRRFKDTDLFEQIFSHILQECYKFKLIDPGEVFVDATHVKARANNKKMQKRIACEEALFFEELLKKEINEDREAHGRRPLKEKDDDDSAPSGGSGGREEKTVKTSTSDPESGWFRKGEHKNVFAYAVQTACDKNGWILGYSVHPGNHHDSRTFKALYDKIKDIGIETLIADAGYKTPGIAKLLIDDGIRPLMPYKRPMTKEGFFKKYEYVYDEYYDCYICPNNKVLNYSTTDRDGYREYKSCGWICADCPYLAQCTQISLYTNVWQSPDGNESRVDICLYESEKAGKDQSEKRTFGEKVSSQIFYFRRNLLNKRKMALVCMHQSRFVYSLRRMQSIL